MQQSLAHVSAVPDIDRANALARIAENGELILRVFTCLGVRVTAYRGALERVVLAQPSPMAADADRAITALHNTRNKVRRKMSFMTVRFNEVIAGGKLIQKKLNPNTTKNGIIIQ